MPEIKFINDFFFRDAKIQVWNLDKEKDWRKKDIISDKSGKYWRILVKTANNLHSSTD
jgi:hypothetical protein